MFGGRDIEVVNAFLSCCVNKCVCMCMCECVCVCVCVCVLLLLALCVNEFYEMSFMLQHIHVLPYILMFMHFLLFTSDIILFF